MYIYQYQNWPNFSWNNEAINLLFGEVRNLQGQISGQMNSVGFTIREETNLQTLTLDIIKSSEVEGELLNYDQVRSSIARRLGIQNLDLTIVDRNIEGIVEMMLDATQNYQQPLTEERLFCWHAVLFPSGRTSIYSMEVGCYRTGDMQIVSGAMGKEVIHYEAVPANSVKKEMDTFLEWMNNEHTLDPVLKAAIAHFWFIIIHPFDDGNGRIARAISDLLLARADKSTERFYSMSSQIMIERKRYYQVLQEVQHSKGDITPWIEWFLNCLKNSLENTNLTLQKVISKASFWQTHEQTSLNERQRLMLNKLLDGFEGKLKSSKWAKITKCSSDTALRDIKDLVEKGILKQEEQGGRSTNYLLIEK